MMKIYCPDKQRRETRYLAIFVDSLRRRINAAGVFVAGDALRAPTRSNLRQAELAWWLVQQEDDRSPIFVLTQLNLQ